MHLIRSTFDGRQLSEVGRSKSAKRRIAEWPFFSQCYLPCFTCNPIFHLWAKTGIKNEKGSHSEGELRCSSQRIAGLCTEALISHSSSFAFACFCSALGSVQFTCKCQCELLWNNRRSELSNCSTDFTRRLNYRYASSSIHIQLSHCYAVLDGYFSYPSLLTFLSWYCT